MQNIPPRKKTNGTKTIFALSTITAGLLALLAYEVLTFQDSPIILDVKRQQSKPLIIIDEETDQGYLIADNGYSIGKTPQISEKIETIQALKSHLNDNSKHLGDLRSQLMTKGTTLEHPRIADLKKTLGLVQDKYTILLEKKKLLKDELISVKEQLAARTEMYHHLVSKKKEIKENYLELQQAIKEKDTSNQELAREVEELRILLANAENGRQVADTSNELLAHRVQDLSDQLTLVNHLHRNLQTDFAKKSVDFDELHLMHNYALKNIVKKNKGDTLTKSIKDFEPDSSRLAVNFPSNARGDAHKTEKHLNLLDQLAYLDKYGYSDVDNDDINSDNDEIHQSQQRIQKLKENVAYYDKRAETLGKTNEELKNEFSDQKSQLDSYEKEWAQLVGAQNLGDENSNDSTYERNSSEKDLYNLSSGEEILFEKDNQIFLLKDANHTLQKEIDSQRQQINSYKAELDNLRYNQEKEDVADNYSQSNDKSLDLNPAPGQLETEDHEEHVWEDEDKIINSDLERLQKNLDESETSKGALEEKVAVLTKQVTELSEQIALNDWTIDHHRTYYENALDELEAASDHLDRKHNDLCASTSCNDALTTQIEKLNRQIAMLQNVVAEKDEHREYHSNLLEKTESDLTAANTCNENLSLLAHRLNDQITDLQDQIVELEKKAATYEGLISEKDNAIAEKEDIIVGKEQHHEQRTQEFDAKTRELNQHSRQIIAALQKKIHSLQENLDEAHETTNTYKDTIAQLNDQLKDEKTTKNAELGKFQNQVQHLNRKIAVLYASAKPAPGIKPNDVKSVPTNNSSKLAYVCSEVAGVGASAFSNCNKSPQELTKEALKAQAEARDLKAQLARKNQLAALQEKRIRHLEANLSKSKQPEPIADNVYDEQRIDPNYAAPYSYPYDDYLPRTVDVDQQESVHNTNRDSSYTQTEKVMDRSDFDNRIEIEQQRLNRKNAQDYHYLGIEEYLALSDAKVQPKEKPSENLHDDKNHLEDEEDYDPYDEDEVDLDHPLNSDENRYHYDEEQDQELDDDIDNFDDTDSDPLALNEEENVIDDEYKETSDEVDEKAQAARDRKYWNAIALNDQVDTSIDDEQPEDNFDYDDELAWDEQEDQRLDDVIEDYGNVDPDPSPPQ